MKHCNLWAEMVRPGQVSYLSGDCELRPRCWFTLPSARHLCMTEILQVYLITRVGDINHAGGLSNAYGLKVDKYLVLKSDAYV